ncbi:copper amine oxidase N-terminal domain-containing protein [Tissierella carlieri]|uniref:Copper amine oxidase N-terminal domain-containing protein n=1 Tax=Tissierella carlieri TaxID=689904 RepID=A0ABT1S9B6_9FIRM|nr:stalk domain-containing protein [Tissierella carlieri]MCQ4923066.1 copper amine oxidase N-terminal domain-containing protein [Tissierella carlieri]
MKGKMKRKLMLLIVAILVVGSSTVFAADSVQNIKGFFSSTIKIFRNGQEVDLGIDEVTKQPYKPFVTNGRTYIPVRAIADVLGKDVNWDGPNSTVYISDKPDENYNYVLVQLLQEQEKNSKLEAKVKELEAELAKVKEDKVSSLTDMENYLNKQYDKYKDVRFEIKLSGDSKDIKVKIYVNRNDNSYWNSLTTSQIEKFVDDIVYDIDRDFKNANISGYIENNYTGKEELSFKINSKGKLEISNYKGSNGRVYDLDDMERELDYSYGRYDSIDFDFSLSGSESSIRVNVKVNSNDWYRYSYKEEFLEKVYDEINYYFPSAEIYGYIDDYYFDFDSRGYVNLR